MSRSMASPLSWLASSPRAERSRPRAAPGRLARSSGPGGGGTMRRPAISPHDPRLVVEGCDMTGAYITRDAGESWRMFHLGRVVEAFAFDPERRARALRGQRRVLWRSEDAGPHVAHGVPRPGAATRSSTAGAITRTSCSRATTRSTRAARTRTSRPWSSIPPTRATSCSRLSATRRGRRAAIPRAAPTVLASDGPRAHVGARRASSASSACSRSARRPGSCAPSARRARTKAAAGELAALRSARRTEDHVRQLRARREGEAHARLRHHGGGHRGDRGRRAHLARGERLPGRDEAGDRRRGVGPGRRARSRASGPIAASAEPRARGLRRPARPARARRATRRSTASPGRRTAAARGRSCNAEAGSARRPTLDGSWIEERALEDGHSVWFDAPYDLAVAPGDPDVCYATDLFRTYRTHGRRAHLGPGQLRAPRPRPVGEPRPRRHQRLRRALGPVRREARVHHLHRHRPLPQRGRRARAGSAPRAACPRAGATRPTGSPSIPR